MTLYAFLIYRLWYQLTIKIKEFVKKIPADDLLNVS